MYSAMWMTKTARGRDRVHPEHLRLAQDANLVVDAPGQQIANDLAAEVVLGRQLFGDRRLADHKVDHGPGQARRDRLLVGRREDVP